MGTRLSQQAPSSPRIPSSLQIPPSPQIPSTERGVSPSRQTLVIAPYPRAPPSRRGTDLLPTGKVLLLQLARPPDVHLPHMLINTGSPATTVQRHIGSTFPDPTLSHELVPNNAQVGTEWLHLLSEGPNGQRNRLLRILPYQGPTHGTDNRGSS